MVVAVMVVVAALCQPGLLQTYIFLGQGLVRPQPRATAVVKSSVCYACKTVKIQLETTKIFYNNYMDLKQLFYQRFQERRGEINSKK